MSGYSKSSYAKRPMWQWILIYLVIGGIVYGVIYYFFMNKSGGNGYSAPGTTQNSQTQPYSY